MSFILDALRKSERERQRQTSPGLGEVVYAPPRKSQRRWVLAIIAILSVNALLVAALLWRGERQLPESQIVQTAPVPPALPAPERRPAQLAAKRDDVRPLADELEAADPATPSMAATPPPAQPEGQATAAAPQPPAARMIASPARPAPAAANAGAGLPDMEQLVLEGRLEISPLRLDIHVFSDQPAGRFVFINMNKYREGDVLKEGPRVEAITADGVVLSQQGNRFLLTR
jgi:general secretion pathway protein B